MRRPEGVATLSIQQLPDDVAVGWNRVAGGFDAREAERPGLVGGELAAQVHVRLFGILALVESGRRRMPHIHFDADDGLIRSIADVPDEEKRRAGRRRANQRAAILGPRRVHPPERTEDGR